MAHDEIERLVLKLGVLRVVLNEVDFVAERGGSVLFLGGKRSFNEGDYFGTPIADLLPVELDGRGTHAVLKSIDTPLDMVQTHAPSLEDAYLEIVGRTEPEGEASADA